MNKNYGSHSDSSHSQVPSGTLAEKLDEVRSSLEFECFEDSYLEQADEISLIIAEMAMLPATALVQIGGNKLTAQAVSEIYSMLTHEDIISVMDNFEAVAYKIKFKKTYLRTALYNEVFERSSRAINDVRSGLPGYYETRREQIERQARDTWQRTR